MSNQPKHKRNKTLVEKISLLFRVLHGEFIHLIKKETNNCSPSLSVCSWIKYLNSVSLPPIRKHIAVLAMRNETWFEWAMYCCCWLRYIGYAPVFVYSGEDAKRIYGCRRIQDLLTYKILKRFSDLPDLQMVDFTSQPLPNFTESLSFSKFASDVSHTLTAYDLHVEEFETVACIGTYKKKHREIRQNIAQQAKRFETIFNQLQERWGVQRLIGYSGIVSVTSAAEEVAQRLGWDRVWVEGWSIRPGQMIWNHNAAALFLNYCARVDALSLWNDDQLKVIEEFIEFQKTGKPTKKGDSVDSSIRYQIANKNEIPEYIMQFIQRDERPLFLLGPNVVGDSATFQRQTIFASQREWLTEVIRFFKEHPEWKLLIRAHPGERFQNIVPVKIGEIANNLAGKVENIRVVMPGEQCNSYALMKYANVGLCWVSNFGIDCVLAGLPTIAAAKPSYSGMGIVDEPKTKDAYFRKICEILSLPRLTSTEQKIQAKKYLTALYEEYCMVAFGPRHRASDLSLRHPLNSSYGIFYRVMAGDLPVDQPVSILKTMG